MHFLATATLALHALWIIWMVFGGFLARGRRGLRAAYLASVAVTLAIAFTRGICPLTDLENYFEDGSGMGGGYEGGFVHHYLSRFVYVGNHFETAAGLQVLLLLLLAVAILVNFRKLRF